MTLASRSSSALAIALLALALAGCGDKKTGSEIPVVTISGTDAATTAAAEGSGDSASGGACPTVPQEGYELFSSDQVLTPPVDGAVYGDGTQIAWTFAGPVDGTPDVDISYINDAGDAIPQGGIFLDDLGNNTWGSSRNIFTSDADGRPAFMILGLTHDAGMADDGTLTGTHEIVGIYCVTLKVAP